jgi:GNAT superfamily N-acetyltransferase/thiol-disulfide isomerase/thioredoxin
MPEVQIRDMDESTEYFVGTCTHVNESEEADACGRRRVAWFREMHEKGLRVKVALLDETPIGFLYAMPIEVCPWGPLGRDLLAVPCLFVQNEQKGKGAGSALIAEAEEEAGRQGKKGLVTTGYYHDFWFMPARFFEKCGFSAVGKLREVTSEGEKEFLGKEAILWKVFDSSAEPPKFLEPSHQFKSIPGKVVVDLFFNCFCGTSNGEAQRVREVAAEFGDSVVLNEYPADDPAVLRRYQLPRGIFINGKQIGWGYEAPREGIRKAISEALAKNKP